MAKPLRNARRANAHSAAREGRLVFTPAMVTFSECAGFYTAEALDLGSRVFGWDREFDSLRASHVTCGVDPDARGAAVAIKIDFSITDAVEQATIVSADVLRPDKRGTIVNGASVFQSSSFFGIHQFEDVTCDSLIERGTKMGNLKAGMAMGAWFGAISATQARFPYARNYHTCEFVDATTWTHGLFGKNAPSKRDRCSIITSWLPLLEPEMRDLRAADREGVADAALIGIYALARVALVALVASRRARMLDLFNDETHGVLHAAHGRRARRHPRHRALETRLALALGRLAPTGALNPGSDVRRVLRASLLAGARYDADRSTGPRGESRLDPRGGVVHRPHGCYHSLILGWVRPGGR